MRAAAVALALALVALAGTHASAGDGARSRRLALIVGTSSYDDGGWARLANPALDARALADVLERRYGFTATTVIDPDRETFKTALGRAADAAGEADDLLLFVAGHGYFDPTDKAGYLVLRDGGERCGHGCYPLDNVKRALYGTRARHVLVLVDACYAGTFDPSIAFGATAASRGRSAATRELLKTYAATRSRLIVASVGKAPTLDGTPGLTHSPFVRLLLSELERPGAVGVTSIDYLTLTMREGATPLPIIAPTAFPAALPHDVNGTFLFVAEGDFCEALEALMDAKVAPADPKAAEPTPWGTSEPIALGLPGAERCLVQRFATDGRRLVRCRYGEWRPDEVAAQRRALDKRVGLCAPGGPDARTAVVCNAQRCALSVVIP